MRTLVYLVVLASVYCAFAAEKQIKLEDIERDNLNSAKQKEFEEQQQRQSQQQQNQPSPANTPPINQNDFPNAIPIFAQFDPQQYQLLLQQPYLIQQAPVTYYLQGNSLSSLPVGSLPNAQALTGSPHLVQPAFFTSEQPSSIEAQQFLNAPPPQQQSAPNRNQAVSVVQQSGPNQTPNAGNAPKEVNIPGSVNIPTVNQIPAAHQYSQPLYLSSLVQYVPTSTQPFILTNQIPQSQRLVQQQIVHHPPSFSQIVQQPSRTPQNQNIPLTSADLTYSTIPYSVKQNINVQLTSNPKHRQQQIIYQQTPTHVSNQAAQQLYNPYNALLHSQQYKNSFSAGTKSTASPPAKPAPQTGFLPAQTQQITETVQQQPTQSHSGRFVNFRGGI